MWADFEENYGFHSHCVQALDRACLTVGNKNLYDLSIAKVVQFHGIGKARQVYQRALQKLHGKD